MGQQDGSDATGPAPDVADLVGTYRQGWRSPASPRATRWLTVIALVVLGVALTHLVTALVADGPAGLLRWLGQAVQIYLFSALAWLPALRPPLTRIEVTALTARIGLFTTRTVGWEQVRAIRAPGRWDLHAGALLADGDRMELPGLPEQVVGALAAAVGRVRPEAEEPPARRTAQSSGAPVTGSSATLTTPLGGMPGDGQMDGPFRSGAAPASGP